MATVSREFDLDTLIADTEAEILRLVGDHDASIALHKSCGFDQVGREREVGRKFNRWLDVVLMQKML